MKLLVLKVTRDDAPDVWRRVRVPAEVSLGDLHVVVQAVMMWDDAHAHRFKLGSARANVSDEDTARLDTIFTLPDTAIGYVYDERWQLTIVAESLDITAQRSNDDFACLAADDGADVAALDARIRRAFVTVAYHADREPTFDGWRDPAQVEMFREAVTRYLGRREAQPGQVLRERANLQTMLEELLASSSMSILREAFERLRSGGLGRAFAMDALVALAASFDDDVTDVAQQTLYLQATAAMTVEMYKGTFPDGPVPVISARIALRQARERNQRRRRR